MCWDLPGRLYRLILVLLERELGNEFRLTNPSNIGKRATNSNLAHPREPEDPPAHKHGMIGCGER